MPKCLFVLEGTAWINLSLICILTSMTMMVMMMIYDDDDDDAGDDDDDE